MGFATHGVFVGIAAILFATQLSIIQSTVPPNLELSIITASVVGGVSILGGTGTVLRSTPARLLAPVHQRRALFVAAGAGHADPADRARGSDAATPAGGAVMSSAGDTTR